MRNKRIISCFITLFLMVNGLFINSINLYANVDGQNGSTYDECDIETQILSEWQNHYIMSIKINNPGTDGIDNWSLYVQTDDTITSVYGGNIIVSEAGYCIIKNEYYNQDIECGSYVEISFVAEYNDEPSYITQINLLENDLVEIDDSEYTVDIRISDVWNNGGRAEITVNNISDRIIEDWVLKIKGFPIIENIWGAYVIETTDSEITVKKRYYNQNIKEYESIVFGVIYKGFWQEDISYKLFSFVPNIDYYNNISISSNDFEITNNNNDPEAISDEYTFFKDVVSEDEITYNVDGIKCVKNQLIIIMKNYDEVEIKELLDKYHVNIVGMIGIGDFLQIESQYDLSCEELSELLVAIKTEPIVSYVGYNFVTEPSSCFSTSDPEVLDGERSWHLDAVCFSEALVEAGVIESIDSSMERAKTNSLEVTKIGVIDSWFYEEYEDFEGIIAKCWNNNKEEGKSLPPKYIMQDIDSNLNNRDIANHGSGVLEFFSGGFNNEIGSTGTGIKNRAYLYSYASPKSLPDNGRKTHAELMFALAKLIGNGVKVINYSVAYPSKELGLYGGVSESELIKYSNNTDAFLEKLIDKGYDFLIISAAGNMKKEYSSVPDAKNSNEFTYSEKECIKNRVICVGAAGHTSVENDYYISDISAQGDRIDIYAPGESVFPYNYYYKNYFLDGSGTSYAAPIVAGAASFTLSVNPYLDSVTLKEIITKKENMTMIDDSNGMLNMQAVIKEAVLLKQNAKNISGIVRGTLLYEDEDVPTETDDGLNKNNIINRTTQIEIYDTKNGEAELVRKTVADADGSFKLQLGEGAYILRIKRQGYIDKDIDVDVYRGSERILGTITLEKDKIKKYKYELSIHDFITDTVVQNVNINVREGWNNHTGEKKIASTVNSNNVTISTDGKITLRIEKGYYTVEVFCDGYISEFQNIYVEDNIENITVYLIPVSNEGGYAFILRRKKDDEIYMRVDAHSVCRSDDRLYGKDEGFYDSREPSLFNFRDDVLRISKQASVTSRSIGDELIEVFNIHDQGTLLYDFHVYKGINTAGDYSATVICDGEILKSYNSVSSRHLYICDIWGDIYNEINKDNAQTYYDCTGTLWWKYNMEFYRADWYYGEKDLLPDQL